MAYRSTERTETRRAEIRERITTAARELIAEGGYVAAQVAAVADRARIVATDTTIAEPLFIKRISQPPS